MAMGMSDYTAFGPAMNQIWQMFFLIVIGVAFTIVVVHAMWPAAIRVGTRTQTIVVEILLP